VLLEVPAQDAHEPPAIHVSTNPEYEPLAPVIRLAPEPPESDRYSLALHRRRRRRIVVACLIGLAAMAAVTVWQVRSASAHYDRGRRALADEQYYAAVQELGAAHIFGFSYRDADALAKEAREALDEGIAEAVRRARVEEAVRRLTERADAFLTRGAADDVLRVLTEARRRVPEGPLSSNEFTLGLLDTLSRRITQAADGAISGGRWGIAETYAVALRAIHPDDETALSLAVKARLGERLQRKLADARAAARRGEWRRALRLATSVLDGWPGFQGAAAVAAEARAALAPKPAPAPEPTAAAPTTPAQTTPTAPSTPPPPPPP
jgi:hypothetical protein